MRVLLTGRVRGSESDPRLIPIGLAHGSFTALLAGVLLCEAGLDIIAPEYLQVMRDSMNDANVDALEKSESFHESVPPFVGVFHFPVCVERTGLSGVSLREAYHFCSFLEGRTPH